MKILRKQAYFVDLFVRISNKVAIDMYRQLGYSVYRRVLEYYSGDPDEDAFGELIEAKLRTTLITSVFEDKILNRFMSLFLFS